jgi:preprotein translocase subunit SecF
MTHTIIIGLGIFIVVLTILSIYGIIPALRIVPDDTTFDFMQFRRISFPISALLTIAAITLYFTHGLNFGIDFKGGTLLEIQSKNGPADIAGLRAKLGALGLGDVQLQQFGGPADVLIRLAEQPGGDQGQQAAVQKVRATLGDSVEYRRVEVVGPRVSGELLAYGVIGLMLAIFGILIYLWFRFEWQFALGAMIANIHVDCAGRFRSDVDCRAPDHSRLFTERYGRHLRPHP